LVSYAKRGIIVLTEVLDLNNHWGKWARRYMGYLLVILGQVVKVNGRPQ
jgi:hypothetical protein